jgi:hypothetical protein
VPKRGYIKVLLESNCERSLSNNFSIKEKLTLAGFAHFEQLLDKEEEMRFFRIIKEYGEKHQEFFFRPSPYYLSQYQVKLAYIPARFLPIFCARDKTGEIKLTALGKVIRNAYNTLAEKGIEGYFILVSGGAKEAVPGSKPFSKTKMPITGVALIDDYDLSHSAPKMDGDLHFVINSPSWKEKDLLQLLESGTDEGLSFYEVTSRSRPLVRIEIGKIIREKELAVIRRAGHIFFPEFEGQHSAKVPYIQQVMAEDDQANYVLLVPHKEELISGVEINFFPERKRYKFFSFKQKNHEGKVIKRVIKRAFIHWFETQFPYHKSPNEAFFHLLHLLKSFTWDNKLRLVNANGCISNLEEMKKLSFGHP